jgi:type IV secretion system protein VirB6
MATNGALSTDGLNSMALQQGGIGLILTTLIISAPPMAAAFFQGTLGQFQSYSPFGMVGRESAASAAQQQTALGHNSGGGIAPTNQRVQNTDQGRTSFNALGGSGYQGSNSGVKQGSAIGQANGSGSQGIGS